MKTIFYFILPILLFTSCLEQEKTKYFFQDKTFGGKDIHGNLYQQRYPSENDSSIKYQKWIGKKITSNQELEALLKVDPNCEAIYFDYWNHDTLNNLVLTQKIGAFKNLKFLEIHSNRITKYPKSIEKLTKLNELVLHVSQKRTIEFSFSNFKNLKHLTIHFGDQLIEFPSTIFDCKKLESLKLFRLSFQDHNTLSGIEKLKKLKEIYIWDSHLFLPDTPFDFPELETLILDRTRQKLPNYFYTSSSLKRLSISSMFDTIDFDKISQIKNLENLSLHYQKAFTGKLILQKLEHLDVTSYNGESIDIEFDKLPALNSLVIWDCDRLTNMSKIANNHLRSITLIDNDKIKSFPFDKRNLKALEEITMRSNDSLTNKPAQINDVLIKEFRKK